MFEQTGAVWVTPGGDTEHPEAWGPVVRWCALNIGAEADRDPDWNRMRQLCAAAGVAAFPWLHCHTYPDIDRLIAKAQAWGAPAVGLNIEDVVTDGLAAGPVKQRLLAWGKDCLVITLPWLANGWGWGQLSAWPFALEYFPYDPAWNPVFNDRGGLRDHACAEGAKMVSFMYGTYPSGVARPDGTPPYDMRVAHSLYTGNSVGADVSAWHKWDAPTSNPYMPCPGGGGTPVPPKSLTEKQVPYTGPYSMAGNGKHKGPTAEAMKRALSRAGAPSLPWTDFNNTYNQALENAWDWYDAAHAAGTANNGYAKGRWERLRAMMANPAGPHASEHALDSYGQTLIQNEAKETSSSTPLTTLQGFISDFCKAAIQNADEWHYDQNRPVKLNINPWGTNIQSDCSGIVIQAVDYARRNANLVASTQDPAKQNWTGYGNTDYYEDDWPKVSAPFRVGDLAHFANSRHVIICYQAGDRSTARWLSNGQESDPRTVDLASYRTEDFMFVVRPDYLPAV